MASIEDISLFDLKFWCLSDKSPVFDANMIIWAEGMISTPVAMKWNDSHELCAPQYLARSVDSIVNHVCTKILPFTYATSHSTSPSNDKAKVHTNLATLIYAISQRSSVYPFRWLHRPINVCSCNVANCAARTALKAEECLSNIK